MKYKLLGKTGLRVSELCLGVMTFGESWALGTGKEESKKVFDAFAEAGGNFLDTANRYTEGESEKIVGEFIHSDRHHFVLATKYTLYDRLGDVNFAGNHRKNMMRSVEGSLKRLNTDFIDVLYVHSWDFLTPVDEVLRGLDDLVTSGKVLYAGISDTPAWIVSKANTIADFRDRTRFNAMQIEYSLIERTVERELLPMAKGEEITVTAWAPLAGGALTGKYLDAKSEKGRLSEDSKRLGERASKITREVVAVAKEMGCSPAQVAIKWVMQKNPMVIPVIGSRKVHQLKDNLGVLDIVIPDEMMERLDEVSRVDMGFPYDFLKQDFVKEVTYAGMIDRIINHRK